MSLARADAEPVFRCAFRLEQVAQDVSAAAARTAGAFPDDWRGDAGIAYQQRLDTTADRVRRVAAAYDAAGAALLPYARALVEAQDLALRAESLFTQAAEAAARSAAAARLGRLDGLADPGPAEALREAASRLQAEAIEVERRAAAICAAALEDEASRAPATSAWRSVDRFVGDVARVGVETVAGAASLIGSAWNALPTVGSRESRGEARDELLAGAKAAAQVWKIPVEVREAIEDQRPGVAAATLVSVLGAARLSKMGDQTHLSLKEEQALRKAELKALLAGREKWRQTADEMGRRGVVLLNEEKRGGHTWRKHVGQSLAYLQERVARGLDVASSFDDLSVAEQAVNAVLKKNAHRIAEVYSLPPGKRLELTGSMPYPVGTVVDGVTGHTFRSRKVLVVLDREKGQPVVLTAYPIG